MFRLDHLCYNVDRSRVLACCTRESELFIDHRVPFGPNHIEFLFNHAHTRATVDVDTISCLQQFNDVKQPFLIWRSVSDTMSAIIKE